MNASHDVRPFLSTAAYYIIAVLIAVVFGTVGMIIGALLLGK